VVVVVVVVIAAAAAAAAAADKTRIEIIFMNHPVILMILLCDLHAVCIHTQNI